MPHDKDLVARVAAEARRACYEAAMSSYQDKQDRWKSVARYALDLAERAADAAVTVYRLGGEPEGEAVLARAVRRAVEGA